MKKFLFALLFFLVVFSPFTPSFTHPQKAEAGVPVIDEAAIAQLIVQVKQVMTLLGMTGDMLDTSCQTWGAATQSILGNFGLGSWNTNLDELINYLGVGDIFGGAGQSGTLKTGGLAGGALQGIYSAEDLMISIMKMFGVGLSSGQYDALKKLGFIIPEAIYGNATAGGKCQTASGSASKSGGSNSSGWVGDAAKSIVSSVCGGNLNALTSNASNIYNSVSQGDLGGALRNTNRLINDPNTKNAVSTASKTVSDVQNLYNNASSGEVFSVTNINLIQSILSQYGTNLSTDQITGLVNCGALDANAILEKYVAPAPSAEPTIPIPSVANCARYTNNGGCLRVSSSIPQGKNGSFDLETDPAAFIFRAYTWILAFAGAIALLLIIRSGEMVMWSKGRPEAVQAGKEQLTAAIVGLLFIILAFVLFDQLAVNILNIPGICNDKTKNCVQFSNPYQPVYAPQGSGAPAPTGNSAKDQCMTKCQENNNKIDACTGNLNASDCLNDPRGMKACMDEWVKSACGTKDDCAAVCK